MRPRRRGMRKWLVVLAAFLVIGIPAAYAASSANDKPAQAQSAVDGAAKKCKAERTAMGAEAFAKYGTNHNLKNAFGKCVSSLSEAKNKD
jgi:hypothetical protein